MWVALYSTRNKKSSPSHHIDHRLLLKTFQPNLLIFRHKIYLCYKFPSVACRRRSQKFHSCVIFLGLIVDRVLPSRSHQLQLAVPKTFKAELTLTLTKKEFRTRQLHNEQPIRVAHEWTRENEGPKKKFIHNFFTVVRHSQSTSYPKKKSYTHRESWIRVSCICTECVLEQVRKKKIKIFLQMHRTYMHTQESIVPKKMCIFFRERVHAGE